MFKKCKAVMLPTNQKAINKNQIVFNKAINNLYVSNKDIYKEDWNKLCTPHLISPQHLYITSDEEIKEGDWFIFTYKRIYEINSIYQCTKHNINELKDCKKIIATTDTSLKKTISPYIIPNGGVCASRDFYLPQPSQQFIEKYIEEYNKGNVITDVLVEYEEYMLNEPFDTGCGDFVYEEDIRPKVNQKNNTITIKKVKDSYSQKEVNELFEKYDFEIKRFGILDEYKYNYLEIWKKENL